jgi:hypothetical protein
MTIHVTVQHPSSKALDIATGASIGCCYPKHRSSEFRKFLDQIEMLLPASTCIS